MTVMICVQCQNAMNPQERFCSKCGKEAVGQRVGPAVRNTTRNWDTHVTVLAWIFIVSAIFMAIPGLFMMLIPGMMMGRAFRPFPPAGVFFLMGAFAFITIPAGLAIAGIGLLRYREWARILTLILASLMLIGIPFGTAIGIYAFWVLLSGEGSRSYKRRSVSPERSGWSAAPGEG